jgi:NTE family protein
MDAYRKQALTTSMRMDLFYQSAECQTIPDSNGVRIVLKAGNRKTNQLHVGLRYDSEEHASLQVGANVPLKAAIPVNADCALRLGRRLMARGELTFHAKYFACPTLTFTYRRNDIDIYINGERDYNVLYNQYQADFVPLTLDVRHFILKMGLRWDYIQYRNKLESNHTNTIKLDTDHYLSYRALLNYNSEDNWNFPTRGARFRAEYAYYADKYTQLDGHKFGISDINAHWRKSFTIGSRFTLQPMLYGRLLIGTDIPFVFGNTIGGNWFGHYVEQQMPFAGIGNMEYVDKEFIAGQMQAQQRIGKNHYVLLRVAGGLQCDRLRHLLDQKMMLGCQGSYYYNTMFGPIGGSLGYSNRTKEIYLHINLGYEF